MTLNFIPLSNLEESCENLRSVRNISQLYLTGNPCTDWELYRKVVIAMVPQLKQLDSKEITHSERLEALQELPELLEQLKIAIRDNLFQRTTTYTKEARVEMAKENERIQEEKTREKKTDEEKEYGIKKTLPPPVYNDKGEVRQCNQGGYEYSFFEKNEKNRQFIILEVAVPKYLDTSKMDVDLNPTYVRINIKGKFLQLTFPCEIVVDESQAKRSQLTGSLQLIMPKQKNSLIPYFFLKEEIEEKKQKKSEKTEKTETKTLELENTTRETLENTIAKNEEWEDDSEVPPLE